MEKKREQDFADLEVKRLCGVFGTPIRAAPGTGKGAGQRASISSLPVPTLTKGTFTMYARIGQ